MVLEYFLQPLFQKNHPLQLFFLGIFYSTFGGFLALLLFPQEIDVAILLFTILACVPFLYKYLEEEEKKDLSIFSERKFLKEYYFLIKLLMYLFLGFLVGFLFFKWITLLFVHPFLELQSSFLSESLSPSQLFFVDFIHILSNNFTVLLVCMLLSFLFGVGAIFIITWNASILAAAIWQYVGEIQYGFLTAFLAFSRFFIHGIFEIAAFFIAGVAGSILSFAFIHHSFGTKKFLKIFKDSLQLFLIASVLLILGAIIEVWITPLLFGGL